MRIQLSVARILAAALIWGGLLSLPAHAAGRKSGGVLVVTDDLIGGSAGTVGAAGGAFTLDGTLSQVATATGMPAGASPFTVYEAGYFTMMTTTPVNSSFLPVSTKTVTVSWSVSNPTGTLYLIDASTAANFTGAVVSTALYNSSYTIFGGLSSNATYYLRYKANYMEGDETAFHPLGSTRTLAGPEPTLIGPASGAYISTTTPTLVWSGFSGSTFNLRIAADAGFATVVEDSTTAGSFFVSTSVLANNTTYWWRVSDIVTAGVSATGSFVVDVALPSYTGPQVSTAAAGPWTNLPMTTYLSSNVVTARITLQDTLSGLLVSSGPPSGLVGQWHFDESSGTTALDASPNSMNGAFAGTVPSWAEGKRGGAVSMPNQGRVAVTHQAAQNASELTIELWIKPTMASLIMTGVDPAMALVAKRTSNSATPYVFAIISTGRLLLNWWNSPSGFPGAATAQPVVQLNVWQHVAVTRTISGGSATVAFYVNGAPVSSSVVTGLGSVMTSSEDLWIGRDPYYAPLTTEGTYQGLMDEVRVFNVARSSAQILADYQSDTLAAHNRGKAYAAQYSTDGGAAWNFVSTNSVTLTGADGTTGVQTLTAADIPLVTSTAAFAPTNLVRFITQDVAGNVSTATYAVLVDTTSPTPPGCETVVNVRKTGINAFTTIQAAVNSLPTILTGNSCVVIRDAATYNEQVTVRNFTNNGSSITIMGDPALSTRPAVVPALGGFAIFNIANASVVVSGIRVSPTVAIQYGIYISSPNVTISSVNVLDSMSMISSAGIATSSWTTVSYTSVSVTQSGASAIWLQGSTMTIVAYSTAANSSDSRPALFLDGASSNTITGVVATNQAGAGCHAARIENGAYNTVNQSSFTAASGSCSAFRLYSSSFNTVTLSHMLGAFSGADLNGSASNTISLSTMISIGASSRALYLTASDSNTVTGSYMQSLSGYGAMLDTGADYNTISQSTMVSNTGGVYALYIAGSDGNTVTGSRISNAAGDGALLTTGADYNTISQSTMAANGAGARGLYLLGADSNTVTGSYISSLAGDGAYITTGAECNTISQSTMVSSGAGYRALQVLSASSNTITRSYITSSAGDGATLNTANGNTISLSTMISNTQYGLYAITSDSNTVTQSYMWGATYGAFLDGGSDYNTISLNTMIGNTQNGLSASGAAWNTVTQSSLLGGNVGAYLVSGSNFNAISLSTMIGNGSIGLYAAAAVSNTVTQSYIWGSGSGAFLTTGSNLNTISLSTMIGSTIQGFYAYDSDSNTVTQSSIWGGQRGASLEALSDYNAINLSTMISNNAGNAALSLTNNSSNTIQNSYIQGSTAAIVNGSTGTVINSSVLVATNTFGSALALQGAGGGLTVAGSTLRGGPSGRGLLLDVGRTGVVSIGSVTVTGSARGLEISTQAAGFILAVDSITFRGMTPGATAIHYLGGTFTSTFTLANFEDASVGANVSAAALDPASRVLMFAHYGVRTSTAYENDPSGVVFWEAGAYPGCVVTRNVGVGQPYATIQAGVNALPATLTGHSCVVVRDVQAYSGQVTVEGFVNNGSSITIMADPSLSARPAVNASGTAGFLIKNASVTVSGFTVRGFAGVAYGIWASSANVTISSVNVIDPSSFIGTAGVALSSYSTLSYSSVTVSFAVGVRLDGAFSLVSYSSMANNSNPAAALLINGVGSNTVTNSFIANAAGNGAVLQLGAEGNTIIRSTMTSGTGAGLAFTESDSNTVTGSYMGAGSGAGTAFGAAFVAGSNYNTISQSTMASNASSGRALSIDGSSWNLVTQSLISSPLSYGAYLNNAHRNTVSLSTVAGVLTSGFVDGAAMRLVSSSYNVIAAVYIQGALGHGLFPDTGSDANEITGSTITSANTNTALYIRNSSSNTITASNIFAPTGTGARFDNSRYNTVSLSTLASNVAAGYAYYLNGADGNTVTGSYLANPAGYGAYLSFGSDYNMISLSTMASNASGGAGLYIDGSDSNTVTGSYMSNPAGFSATLEFGSDDNTISLSAMASNASNDALSFFNSSRNTVADSRVSNPAGRGVIFTGSDYNTISQSTIASGSWAVKLSGSSTNTIQFSYIQGSTAVIVSGSTGTAINSSVLVATNTAGTALALQLGYGMTLASSTLRGGPSGRGLLLDVGFRSTVFIGSVTVTGSARGLEISTQAAGFMLAVDSITFRGMTPGATAIHFLGGAFTSSITLANFEDASVGANVSAAALDAFPASRISMFAHYGVRTSTAHENDPSGVVFWEAGAYPGCVVTMNVGAGQPYATIQAGVNALPATLTGHSCVVIRDGATYPEEVKVQGFVNNGSSITIMGDPASSTVAPRVSPPPASVAAFRIMNSSVNLTGIDVRTSGGGGLSYGISVSSTYVTISSVNVYDASSMISWAGILLSSWTTVSHASVTVSDAYAFWLAGSTMSSVSYSSAANNSAGGKPAVYLADASSNTLTRVTARNQFMGYAVRVDGGRDNTISQSSFTGGGSAGLYLYASSFNAVTGTYMSSSGGYGLRLDNANYNGVSQSTAIGNSAGFAGVQLDNSSSNTISGVLASNPSGYGGVLNGGSNNTVTFSTFNSGSQYGLFMFNSSSNTVAGSYVSNAGGTALYLNLASSNTFSQVTVAGNSFSYGLDLNGAGYNRFTGVDALTGARLDNISNNNVIIGSTFTRNDVASHALHFAGASSNTVTSSFMANPSGTALQISGPGNTNYNTVSQSTITSETGATALYLSGTGNTFISNYIGNAGGYGAQLQSASYSAITQSTIANNSGPSSALYLWSATSNTVSRSVIVNRAGSGVELDSSANWSLFSESVVRGGASGIKVQSPLEGLSIVLSTVTGAGASGAGLWVNAVSSYVSVSHSYVQGSTGVYLSGARRTSVNASVIAGEMGAAMGLGLFLTNGGQHLAMSSNTVLAGGLGGIAVDGNSAGAITLSTNTVITRGAPYGVVASDLHPAAVVWITSNTILPSLSASATTYGVFLSNLPGGATVQNNGIFYRTAGAAFGDPGAGAYGLYAKDSSGIKIDHNRISNPSMITAGNYIGAALSGTTGAMLKFNDLHSTGAGLTTFNLLRVTGSGNTVVKNNILSSSMTATTNRLIVVDAASVAGGFASDYNTYFSSNASYSGDWNGIQVSMLTNWRGTTGRDANTLSGNPLWANPAGEDFHPLSRGGRWTGAGFVSDAVDSPTIDRADPSELVVLEVSPNGVRANQGSYGQTDEASRTVLPCPVTLYVRKAGDGDSLTIQGAINALANPIVSGHSCVVIGDSGIYDEAVTVQNFTNNGSSITIMLDPSLTAHPIVRSGFVIRNASVNIVGIDVATAAPAVGMNYGIFASSANVNISSVNVRDPFGFILVAGVALSSYSTLSYSSISVQGAHGLYLDGKFSVVTNSTMTNNSPGFNGLYMAGADSNTVAGSYISNPLGYGAVLESGADYNTISQSTMVSGAVNFVALYLTNSKLNAVTGSYIEAAAGYGALMSAGADYNAISFSTMTSGDSNRYAYYLNAADHNTVTASFIQNLAGGYGVFMQSGSDNNTISLSTIVANSAGRNALYLVDSDSNAVTGSYISNASGGAAYLDISADYNTIGQSTIASVFNGGAALLLSGATSNTVTGCSIRNTGAGYGARLLSGSNFNTISQCAVSNNDPFSYPLYTTLASSNAIIGSLFSNPSGISLLLEQGGYNLVSGSTIASAAAGSRALVIFRSDHNTVTRSFISNTGEAVRVHGVGGDFNTISFSTMTGDGDYSALIITGTSSNTVLSSYIQGSTAAIISGSTGTIVNSSVLVATNTAGNALVLQDGSMHLAMSSNTFIAGPRGGGVFLDAGNAGTITLSTNTIRGGAVGLAAFGQQPGTALWITSNTIVPSINPLFTTYGIYLSGLTSGATIQNNGIYYRAPGATGAILHTGAIEAFLSDGLVIVGNRISNPGMITGLALGVGLTTTPNTIFKFNDVHSTGAAISSAYHMRLDASPGTQLHGNVFSSSWSVVSSTAALYVNAASQAGFLSDYNDFFSANSFNSIEWSGVGGVQFPWLAATGRDGNSLARHPRWMDVSPGVEDFHHMSHAGRWNGAAFVNDAFTSGLLDAADPAESFAGEAAPNGSRANLGSYGGTAEASRSPERPVAPAVAGVFTSSIAVSYGLTSVPSNGYITIASTDANFSGTILVSTTGDNAQTTFAAGGLAANTTYFIAVGAVWGEFFSFNTTVLATATLANAPAAASPAFSRVELSSVTVSWLPNGNAVDVATYSFVLSTGALFPNSHAGNVAMSTTPAGALPTATRTSGLAPNTTYFAFAAAVNWHGRPSEYAALGSTATLAADPQTVVSTFSAVGSSSFSVSWSANANPLSITTYTVTVSTASDFNAFASSVSFSTAPASGPSATFTGLGANAIYFLRVRAVNQNGIPTGYTLLGSTETRPVALQAPAIAGVVSVSSSAITATWGLSSLATGYTFVASLVNDPAAVAASSAPLGITATTATVSALGANTTYYLFVQATGPGAATGFSAFGATSTLAASPLTAVSTFSAVFPTSMTVSWLPGGNPVGVTTYTVVLSTGASYPNTFADNRTLASTAPAGASPAASFAGLNDNTAYFLHVSAVNHNGVSGGFVALGSTVTRISAPTTVIFDEISSNTIVASAYAPLPGFNNLGAGQSGTRVSKNAVPGAYHGEAWAAATSLPAGIRDAAAAGFNGKVYLFGGFSGATAQSLARVYDPATALWTPLSSQPSARGGHAAAAVGGKIYAVGGTLDGFTSLNLNEEYDPVTNSWTAKASLGTRSDHLSAAGAGGAVYAFGGLTDGVDNSKTEQYDPAAGAWTVRPDFPAARHQAAAGAAAGPMAGLILAAGGTGPSDGSYAYDTAANTWAPKSAMPFPAEEAAAASLGGKIYVIGGGPASRTVHEYDPAADAWTTRAAMTTGRAGLSVTAAGGRLYAIGGTPDGGANSLLVNEEYDPGTATKFSGLLPNTQAGFRAQARNQAGTSSAESILFSTWTWAALPAAAAAPFAVVEADSITFSWALNGNPGTTEFKARASTAASFGGGAAVVSSDWSAMTSTAALALAPNTTYFFQSAARNGVGGVPGVQTAWAPLGSTATLAALPALAPASFAGAATNGLTVSWLPNGNPLSITTYTVVVSTEAGYPNANAGNMTVASTFPAGAMPTASLAGLVANTTYFAFVSAVNHNGLRTAYAALGSTATLALPPLAASPVFSAVSTSAVTFSWLPNGNPLNVTTYSVVLSTGGAFNSFAGNVAFTTAPAGTLPTATGAAGLNPNTTYYGYAAAINSAGAVSAYASLGSTATLAALPETAITTFTAVHISSLSVSWSAAGNPLAITTYTVQLSTASDFNAFASSVVFSTAPAAGPSATFTGLTDFTQYFFRVRAANHGGTATAFVNLGSTTTVVAPLDPPALAGFVSVDSTSISATWGLVAGATGYTFVASFLPANPPTAVEASSTTFSAAATTAAAYAPALSPNTTYFLFVRANGPMRSSEFAAYGSTSTMAAPPASAVSTFTGVGITSFTVSWEANGNALAITTYTVQLSTAADFNAFATSVTFTTAPVLGPSAMLTGLSGNTSYYLRIRSLNHNGVPSAFVSLGSTLTVASPLFPTVMNSQTGDPAWRRAGTALYSVGFLDTSGSHLDKFQVKASTTAAGLGSDIAPWTDVVVGLSPIDSYSTPWALPAPVFSALLEGVTNYISVRVFNGPPLSNFTVMQDAFYVQKDTTSPVIVDTQAGDSIARSAAGTTYTVAVRDPSSGLAAFQYSASLSPTTANAALIGWTDIALVAGATYYDTPWTVNFAALTSGVTNYISVRSWDAAGATTTVTDAFFVHKDTTGPSVAIAAPQNGSFNSALATLSGTAASIYGVQGTEVSVLDVLSGLYWNPASVAFNSAAPILTPAAGGESWTFSPGIPWVDGASYRAVARSSTTAGLYSTTYATATFIMDLSKPAVAVLAPAPDSTVSALAQISGTAADPAPNPSGLATVEVRLRRNADGLWWNWFTQTWGPAAVSSVTAGTTAWSLSPTPQLKGSLDDGASYFIAVRGSDNALPANQGDFFVSGATFTWQDTTPPSAVADLAAAHGTTPGSINLTWTAAGDDAGAGTILLGEYRIFYSTDIAATASTAAAQIVVSTAGINPGDPQSYTLTGLSPSVTYYVSLALDDGDDNWSVFSNQASTTAAPSPLNAITGHVLDVSTQGITAVQVDCWNASDALVGTTFTLADGSGTFTVGSLPAGNYKLRVTWTVNGFSSSLWQDGISMGSTNVDFYLEINYALATLTGTLGTLTASSFGAGGMGTASVSDSFIELYQQGRQVARTTVQPTGRWTIPGLLPGAYSVRAFTGLGYTAFQDVQLSEGEVKVLGFVFNPLPEASVFAFPNPARASTTIRFETALAPLEAGIYIFDIAGNLVKEIPDSQISRAAAPTYRVAWDLNNTSGRPVAPGVYHVMVKVKGGSENQAAKVIKKLAVVR